LGTLGDTKELVQSMPHLRLLQWLLGKFQGWFSEGLLDGVDRIAKAVGSLALLGAAALLLLSYLVLGIRASDVASVFIGLLGVPLATVLLHYFAAKFLDVGGPLLRESPSGFSSKAFLDCAALGSVLLAVFAVLGGFYYLFQGAVEMAVISLAAAPIFLYVCGVALNPSVINVTVGERTSAGAEAMGIVAFFAKLVLRLVPFVFGVGLVAACLGTGYITIRGIINPMIAAMMLPFLTRALVFLALFPVIVYILFLFVYLLTDVLRAVLAVPGKLDALRRDRK
jgi:hypothetical protein